MDEYKDKEKECEQFMRQNHNLKKEVEHYKTFEVAFNKEKADKEELEKKVEEMKQECDSLQGRIDQMIVEIKMKEAQRASNDKSI